MARPIYAPAAYRCSDYKRRIKYLLGAYNQNIVVWSRETMRLEYFNSMNA